MDLQQILINTIGIVLIIGIIRVLITKPSDLTDVFLKLFLLDLISKVINEMDFDDWDFNDWDD